MSEIQRMRTEIERAKHEIQVLDNEKIKLMECLKKSKIQADNNDKKAKNLEVDYFQLQKNFEKGTFLKTMEIKVTQ